MKVLSRSTVWTGSLMLCLLVVLGGAILRVRERERSSHPPFETNLAASLRAQVLDRYGQLPLQFEANQGQTDPQVQFLARGPGYTLFLTGQEAVLSLGRETRDERRKARNQEPAVLRLKLLGANPSAKGMGQEELPGKVNYFRGNDPKQWRTNVPTYQKVRWPKVYPGVDLVYYGNQGQLEYDFVVAPGADPQAIRPALHFQVPFGG